MAKFNEKVLCLFHKDYKQLKKEANRRGIPFETMEKTTARIIWKDAYDTGYSEGRDSVQHCSTDCCDNAKTKVCEYCFHDICDDTKYRLELTEEQVRVIEWMIDHEFLTDVELSEWCDSFEDVGRI